jgi:hypothetical protein
MIPDKCIRCQYKSKSGRCYNYIMPDDTGARECYKVVQECQDDDDFQFITETTKNRTWLTVDEIKELERVNKIFEKEC